MLDSVLSPAGKLEENVVTKPFLNVSGFKPAYGVLGGDRTHKELNPGGFEPPAYTTSATKTNWLFWKELNFRPNPYQGFAATTELQNNILVESRGIEPRISACKADVFPLALAPQRNDIKNLNIVP